MRLAALTATAFAGLSLAAGNIPLVHVASTCTQGYMEGQDVAQLTVPYTYSEVLSIIGSFKNLTWAGNPANTVTLNGTDNTVGTARMYTPPGGVRLIETIDTYKKPKNGPYIEIHTTAMFDVAGLKVYITSDGQNFSAVCGGRATNLKFTADYCSNNVSAAGGLLHMSHRQSAVQVGKLLGGKKFTSCAALSPMKGSGPMKGEAHPPVNMLGAGIGVLSAAVVWAFLLSC